MRRRKGRKRNPRKKKIWNPVEKLSKFQIEIKLLKQELKAARIGWKAMFKVLEGFLDDEIKNLAEELECSICYYVVTAPTYKCEEDHLICRS